MNEKLLKVQYLIEAVAIRLGKERGYGKRAIEAWQKGDNSLLEEIDVEISDNAEKLLGNTFKRFSDIHRNLSR